MKTLTEIQKLTNKNEVPLTVNEILNFAPENVSESLLLNELVFTLKNEIKNNLISNISHLLRP